MEQLKDLQSACNMLSITSVSLSACISSIVERQDDLLYKVQSVRRLVVLMESLADALSSLDEAMGNYTEALHNETKDFLEFHT